MTDHQPNYRALVSSLFLLAVCIAGTRLLLVASLDDSMNAERLTLIALGGSGVAWFLVELYARTLWKVQIRGWHLFGVLNTILGLPPDIQGWWKGSYQRYDPATGKPGAPVACAFRVRQTVWSTHIIGWGEHANCSESYSVRWLSDKDRHHFKLAWLYVARRNEAEADPGGSHQGVHELHYLPDHGNAGPTLMGWYINNRHWRLPCGDREVQGVGSAADISLAFVGPEPDPDVRRIIGQSAVPQSDEQAV